MFLMLLRLAAVGAELFYCLQPYGRCSAFPEAAAQSGRTHIVIDESRDGSPEKRWTPQELATFRKRGAVVLCYLSIGEAEDYRGYWRRKWKHNPPDFLLAENPRWKGNFIVRYWDDAWQQIILKELERIANDGYDGVYLDIVDGYEHFERLARRDFAINPSTRRSYRDDMIRWIMRLAERGRTLRPGFKVFIQNGEALLADTRLLQAIDGLAVEDLFCDGGKMQPEPEVASRLKFVRLAQSAGKTCFAVEYPTADRRKKVAALARQHAIDLLMTDRDLKTPGTSIPLQKKKHP
ncbi:MAG: endo alpha-1,4 polygalactosaminidase [Victivallales bacterium]|nr:endo alpha-1,4 polygalactosaminidase [Victivallales bacterium]